MGRNARSHDDLVMKRERSRRHEAPAKPDSIFDRMRADHERVLERLNVLEEAIAVRGARRVAEWPVPDVERFLEHLARQFQTHMAAEDEVLYPTLMRAIPETRGALEPLRAEHGTLRVMLADLQAAVRKPASAKRNESIAVQLRDLVDLLRIHIRKEEAVAFGIAERMLSAHDVEAMALRRSASSSKPSKGDSR